MEVLFFALFMGWFGAMLILVPSAPSYRDEDVTLDLDYAEADHMDWRLAA